MENQELRFIKKPPKRHWGEHKSVNLSGGEENETQKHTNGTNDGESKTDSSSS
jgi:hypothetical protein